MNVTNGAFSRVFRLLAPPIFGAVGRGNGELLLNPTKSGCGGASAMPLSGYETSADEGRKIGDVVPPPMIPNEIALAATDDAVDELFRGLGLLLDGFAKVPDREVAVAAQEAHRMLFPNGFRFLGWNYALQADESRRVLKIAATLVFPEPLAVPFRYFLHELEELQVRYDAELGPRSVMPGSVPPADF